MEKITIPPENEIRKVKILSIDKVRKIEIEDLITSNNIENILKKKIKKMKLIKYRGEKLH
jgi:hypothetical protein